VYFDIALGRYGDAVPLGRIVMELKEDVVPKTTGGGSLVVANVFWRQCFLC
jgi:hypothetical protein